MSSRREFVKMSSEMEFVRRKKVMVKMNANGIAPYDHQLHKLSDDALVQFATRTEELDAEIGDISNRLSVCLMDLQYVQERLASSLFLEAGLIERYKDQIEAYTKEIEGLERDLELAVLNSHERWSQLKPVLQSRGVDKKGFSVKTEDNAKTEDNVRTEDDITMELD